MGADHRTDTAGLCLPSGEERGDSFLGGVFKLLFVLGVEEIAVGVYDGERWNPMGDWDVVLLCDVNVVIDMTGVDMDEDKVFGEQLSVGGLLVVVVENLTVAAPVGAEVEEDALVLAASGDHSGGDVGTGVCCFGVEVPIDVKADLRGCMRNGEENLQKQAYGCGGKKRVAEVRDHVLKPFRVR
jgi:hypothetical protein